jgi:hypothetical protein
MTLTEAFCAEALTDATIVAGIGTRLRPMAVPQREQSPDAMYRVIQGVTRITHDGPCRINQGLRLEITVWATVATVAERLIHAFKLKFGPLRGTMGGVGGVDVVVTGLVGPRQLRDPQSQMYGWQLDIIMDVYEDTIS